MNSIPAVGWGGIWPSWRCRPLQLKSVCIIELQSISHVCLRVCVFMMPRFFVSGIYIILLFIQPSLSKPHLVHCMYVCLLPCVYLVNFWCACSLLFCTQWCAYCFINMSLWCVHIVSLTHLDGLAQLCGTWCRVWARTHCKAAAWSNKWGAKCSGRWDARFLTIELPARGKA